MEAQSHLWALWTYKHPQPCKSLCAFLRLHKTVTHCSLLAWASRVHKFYVPLWLAIGSLFSCSLFATKWTFEIFGKPTEFKFPSFESHVMFYLSNVFVQKWEGETLFLLKVGVSIGSGDSGPAPPGPGPSTINSPWGTMLVLSLAAWHVTQGTV